MSDARTGGADLLRRSLALDDFHAVLAAEALGRRLDAALPAEDSVDPGNLPPALREPAERAIGAGPAVMDAKLPAGDAVLVARAALAAAAATPAAAPHLAAALEEAEAPPRTQFVLETLAVGAALSLVLFVAKLRIDPDGNWSKEPVGDEALGQLAGALGRVADAAKALAARLGG